MNRAAKTLAFLLIPTGIGLLADFGANHWPPLFKLEKKFLFPPGESAVIDLATDKNQFTSWQISPPETAKNQLDQALTGLDPDRLFQENPPSAPDWLVILNRAKKIGYKQVSVSSLLSWENADPLELSALEHAFSQFSKSVLAIDLRREATDAALPPYLRRSAIPMSCLHGSPDFLPIVNRVPFPPSATGEGVTFFGFRQIETSPPEIRETHLAIPLLARWDDQLLPSFELAHLMAAADCQKNELEITPGRHIRLGQHGPLIPVDKFCRLIITPTPKEGEITPVTSLLDHDLSERVEAGQKILFSAQDGPPHLRRIADKLTFFAERTFEKSRHFTRLAHWQSGLIFFAISALFLSLKRRKHRFFVILPLLFLPTAILHAGHWLLFSPFALCLMANFLIPTKTQASIAAKKAPEKENPTNPKNPEPTEKAETETKTEPEKIAKPTETKIPPATKNPQKTAKKAPQKKHNPRKSPSKKRKR